jgi:ribonuclease HI
MGWKKSNRRPVLNKSLWIELDGMTPEFKSIKIRWVKGHADDELNCKVDSMAKSNMAESSTNPPLT